jgi:hypothetical protein
MSTQSAGGHLPHPSKTDRGSPCWYYSESYTWRPAFFAEFAAGDEPRVILVDASMAVIVVLPFRSVSFSPVVPKEAPVKPRVGGGGS